MNIMEVTSRHKYETFTLTNMIRRKGLHSEDSYADQARSRSSVLKGWISQEDLVFTSTLVNAMHTHAAYDIIAIGVNLSNMFVNLSK
jgi:hypothetical protein